MDFTGINSLIEKKLNDREVQRAIRLSISAEQDAVHLYELISDSISDDKMKKLFQDIANEEKVHIGEFQAILQKLDKNDKPMVEKGNKEAIEKIAQEAFQDELKKIAEECKTPGKKIRSKGLGRGLAIGRGKGPIRRIDN